MDLGIAVQKACENATQPLRFLYPLDIGIKDKIAAIAKSYGADGVEYSEQVDFSSAHTYYCTFFLILSVFLSPDVNKFRKAFLVFNIFSSSL